MSLHPGRAESGLPPGAESGVARLAETSVLSCVPPSAGASLEAARGDRAALSEKWAETPASGEQVPASASVDLVPCLPRSCLLSWPHRCTLPTHPALPGWQGGLGTLPGRGAGGLLHGWGGQGAVTCPGISQLPPALGQKRGLLRRLHAALRSGFPEGSGQPSG